MSLRLRAVVAKLDDPERSRVTNDRASDLFTDLASQSLEDRLGSLPSSPGQNVRAVFVEHEHRAARPSQDGACRHDELERRLLIGQKTREEKRSHSPDHIPGGDRGEVVDPAQ